METDPFDPEILQLDEATLQLLLQVAPVQLRRRERRSRFLKGPLPLDWLEACCRLPGKALHVGLWLWHRAGLERSQTIRLYPTHLKGFGCTRMTAYRALQTLERAGLVQVVRYRGRPPLVTIVDQDAPHN